MIIRTIRPQDIDALYARATRDADTHGIIWQGDTNSGSGSGFGFDASYEVCEDYITITIKKRPLLASKGRIQDAVNKYVA